MIAFHGDPSIKEFYLARVRAHRAADEIAHGVYFEESRTGKVRACAVGCTLHSSSHAAYERELGIPCVLAQLEDGIFESLRAPEDQAWPEAFLEAIPVGADLGLIWPRFFLQLATDTTYGLLRHVVDVKYARQKAAIENVIDYYREWVGTEKKPAAAAAYAYAYASSAAAVASASAYAYASSAAAASASASAYASSADAAADADAAAAAAAAENIRKTKNEVRRWQSQVLLALLREAPVSQDAVRTEQGREATL
jgi:hypothetical protein